MGRLYLPLADILSDAGIVVRVTSTNAGFETRARGSGGFDAMPLGVMWHHAASARGANSEGIVNYQVRVNDDAPVGNMTLDRDGSVWPVAAGASNCSGKGGPWTMSRGTVPPDSGNTTLVNVETCNDGVGEPWPTAMIDGYFALSNAVNAYCGNTPGDIVGHNHYTPTRKIDPATAAAVEGPWQPRSINSSQTWNLADMIAEAQRRATPTPRPPDPIGDDDVDLVWITTPGRDAVFVGYRVRQAAGTFVPYVEWVNGNDAPQLARLDAYRNLGIPQVPIDAAGLRNVTLQGPVPTGDPSYTWSRGDFGNVV